MKTEKITIEERNKIIATIFQLRKKMEEFSFEMENNSDDEIVQEYLMKKLDKTATELEEVESQYIQGLVYKIISRCPFSNEPFGLSIDTFGLDGPWWVSEQPVRGIEEEIKTFFAITGSISILDELPEVSFSMKPGPAVPWVSPRLLNDENIIAVLSHIKIGIYDAYPIVYYSKDKTLEIERINTWGTNEYLAEDIDGLAVMGSTFDDEEEYDFDIASWIKKGKLKWISIDDESLELHNTIADCPYLDLSGYHYPVHIQNKISTNCMIILEYDDDDINNDEMEKRPKFCANCGTPVIKDSKFCANCGNKLN
ncbi:zinc ribbon domain-containing protein [Lutibacter citreus]|uniref:zinc ribbon domain-containing protein n=1 Tax=Lutibacter citreus TaxID=2138210 RepID=UPI000DBE3EBA|nr:zinc ribbon domain-containing protein [Lutibacter citreus]